MQNVNMRVSRNLKINNGVTFDCSLLFVFQEIKQICSKKSCLLRGQKFFPRLIIFQNSATPGSLDVILCTKNYLCCSLWWKKTVSMFYVPWSTTPQVVLLQSEYFTLLQARITLNWTETTHFIFGLHFVHYGYSLASFVSLFHLPGCNTFHGCNLHTKLHTVCRHSKPE